MPNPDPNRRGGHNGPPDLDEAFRQLKHKIARIWGAPPPSAPPNGSGPSSPPPMGWSLQKGLSVAAVAASVLWLASGFYMVDAREEGIVLQFGRYHSTSGPGLQWHWPYPFEKVEIVNLTEVRSIEVGYRGNAQSRVLEESLMLTQDQNIIDLQLSVQYDIKDAKAFLFQNATQDRDAKDIVKQAAETAIREVVGRSQVDYVLNEGRAQLAIDIQQLIQQILDRYKVGIRIAKVNINNVQPPEPVIAAFDDAVKAGQDKEKLRNEGIAYSNDVIPKARGMASRLIEEAQAYKQRVVDTAEGDAARFTSVLSQYQAAPKVMRDRLYLDMMQQVLSNTSKVMVDDRKGSNLLYLPLDKLMQNANAPSLAPAPAAQASSSQAAETDSRGGRDLNRVRE